MKPRGERLDAQIAVTWAIPNHVCDGNASYGHFNAATSLFVVKSSVTPLIMKALGLPYNPSKMAPETVDISIN